MNIRAPPRTAMNSTETRVEVVAFTEVVVVIILLLAVTPDSIVFHLARPVSWLVGRSVLSPSHPKGQWQIESALTTYSRGGG